MFANVLSVIAKKHPAIDAFEGGDNRRLSLAVRGSEEPSGSRRAVRGSLRLAQGVSLSNTEEPSGSRRDDGEAAEAMEVIADFSLAEARFDQIFDRVYLAHFRPRGFGFP